MKVEFHPSTVDDVNEAAAHYGRARPGLDAEFRAELVIRHHKRHPRFGLDRP